jgi:hypothetical protein
MVKWSVPARNDLKQIHDYIANDSKYYAQNMNVRWGWLKVMYWYSIIGAGGFGLAMVLFPETA